MAFFETDDGGHVHFEHHRGEKIPVVLIHGWGMSGEYWASAVEAVQAEGFGAIVVDHRGCGRSDRDFPDMSIGAIAADVAAIVRQCGVSRIVLNGWSLGAAVAVAAADLLREQVAGIILTCGASPRYVQGEDFPHGGTAEDVLGIGAAITSDRPNFFRTLAEGACGEGASEALIAWVERGFLGSGPRASETLAGLATLDQRELLSSFPFPILCIGGAKDTIADPAIAGFAAKCASKGTLLTLDTGHSPQLEAPTLYNDALLEFMRKIA
ncbi:MAG: alpha/beta hydrolase [Erythrobacter sp.]|uniref:alpha/beta fold hydrolase n=1 Tax=Erythrobacter sp. TaxID=1042 RepID=UPI001AFF4FEE|nr:alpha/beta hydrolase [Erythrobacter sp.]MBO6766890.1 alpha/beta hydrolase [Erythrobacter sp.]